MAKLSAANAREAMALGGLLVSHVPTVVWLGAALFFYFTYQLYRNQNSLLYYPVVPGLPFRRPSENPPPYDSPSSMGLTFDNLRISTTDGKTLHAWWCPAPANTPHATTIVFFHANAGNMGFRLPNVKLFVERLHANVLIFDYRGYGDSSGSPTEAGLECDADAILDYVMRRPDVDRSRVVLFGRSLGGAVAVRAASKRPSAVAALVLENTFTSISDMVDIVLPLVAKLKWLVLHIGWRSIDLVPQLHQPILFISGSLDAVVPTAMVQRLHAAATRSSMRELYVVEGGGHNDCPQVGGATYGARIAAFLSHAMSLRVSAAMATATALHSPETPAAQDGRFDGPTTDTFGENAARVADVDRRDL